MSSIQFILPFFSLTLESHQTQLGYHSLKYVVCVNECTKMSQFLGARYFFVHLYTVHSCFIRSCSCSELLYRYAHGYPSAYHRPIFYLVHCEAHWAAHSSLTHGLFSSQSQQAVSHPLLLGLLHSDHFQHILLSPPLMMPPIKFALPWCHPWIICILYLPGLLGFFRHTCGWIIRSEPNDLWAAKWRKSSAP